MISPGMPAEATAPIPPDAPVLSGRPLRDGAAGETTSRYHDSVWDLSPAVLQKQQPSLVLDFTTLPIAFRSVAKELSGRICLPVTGSAAKATGLPAARQPAPIYWPCSSGTAKPNGHCPVGPSASTSPTSPVRSTPAAPPSCGSPATGR
jgi:hypothetical protein